VLIRKIESLEIDRLETDVYSATNGIDAIDHHEVLRGPTAGIV
jgi:hypothetical protein